MNTLFNPSDASAMISRIEKMSPESKKVWGKMKVEQMFAHCANAIEMAMGIINPQRVLIGRLLGGLFKSSYTNEKPFSPGSPTSDELKVADTRDFHIEKERLIKRIKEFSNGGEARCTRHPHPFFGRLTPKEWSRGMYKHLDHHLRQFGS